MSNLFARDPDFLFIAQQFCERFSIERNINCTMRKGQVVTESDGTKNIKNPQKEFRVFEPILGTPSYWHSFRNELYARIEQRESFIFSSHSVLLRCAGLRYMLQSFKLRATRLFLILLTGMVDGTLY